MVLPWRITALLLALLPALAQPAAAGEFSVEEQKLVADIRQKMDQTTQLLIYAYENEEKMDLAEIKRVLAGFSDLADWFEKKIPYRTFERRTGSFCAGAGSFAWSYWNNTESYYKYKGSEKGKYVGAPRTLNDLRERQRDLLEGHFFVFQQCYIHLDQVPTVLEDREKAPKITIFAIDTIRKKSLELTQNIQEYMKDKKNKKLDSLLIKANSLYTNYYSIYNLKIASLFCENFVDFPKYFIKYYIIRHGENSQNQKLPPDLFQIGYNALLNSYYRDVKLCDYHLKKYKEKNP